MPEFWADVGIAVRRIWVLCLAITALTRLLRQDSLTSFLGCLSFADITCKQQSLYSGTEFVRTFHPCPLHPGLPAVLGCAHLNEGGVVWKTLGYETFH